jgi:hypothetical protein
MEQFDKSGVNIEAAGPAVISVPRAAFRDRLFVRHMEVRRALLSEAARMAELGSTSVTLTHLVGSAQMRVEGLRQLAISRARQLATREIAEYRGILNKMHVIEAEAIQRLHIDDDLRGERSRLAKETYGDDVLVFPYNSDEVWFDELDNYRAQVRDCPKRANI